MATTAVRILVGVVIAGLGSALTAGCTGGEAQGAPSEGVVVRVVDGDTIVVRVGGVEESVRLLGIDTPEIAHGGEPADCFGAEAAQHTAAAAPPGTRVVLLRDQEARDVYGRLLAYVVIDGVLLNAHLVDAGFARTLDIAPNNALRVPLDAAERRAASEQRGLWAVCQ